MFDVIWNMYCHFFATYKKNMVFIAKLKYTVGVDRCPPGVIIDFLAISGEEWRNTQIGSVAVNWLFS